MASFNLKTLQLQAFERMLKSVGRKGDSRDADFLGTSSEKIVWSQHWKLLIYDSACMDIISPLITVGRLREHGVTLHMLITSSRDSIPDVPAVYLVQPTIENIR